MGVYFPCEVGIVVVMEMNPTKENTEMNQAEAIYQINVRLADEGSGYTFAQLGWAWDEALNHSDIDFDYTGADTVAVKIPSGTEVSFPTSILQAALGMGG
jgi:hypothetical protein